METTLNEIYQNILDGNHTEISAKPGIKTVVDTLKGAGKHDNVKVIAGGAPVTATFSERVGADGYAPGASRAGTLTKSLLGK